MIGFRFLRVGIILVVLCAALSIGLATPALAAAPPVQAPAPPELASSVGAFIDLLIALAVGGGVAYLLQMSDKWKEWKSPFKPLVVIALTALLGAALTALKVVATSELFLQVPDYARAFISFIVVFVGSQLTYNKGFSPQWIVKQ